MRLLGIDAGEKRIGIALSDRLNKTASPLTVLDNDENLKRNLLEIIRENEIKKIIIGLPYTLKGTKGCQAKIVEDFIENILINIAEETNTEIIEIDETLARDLEEERCDPYKATLRRLNAAGIDSTVFFQNQR